MPITQNLDEQGEELINQLEELDGCLNDDEWKEVLLDIIEGSVMSVPLDGITRNLRESLGNHLENEGFVSLILNVLVNNDPKFYEKSGIEVPEACEDFFQKIVRKYGNRVRHSAAHHYTPNNWRMINSEALVGEESGVRLRSRIQKWDGSSVELTGSLPDMIKLSGHFIRNVRDRFSHFSEDDRQTLLEYLEHLREDIDEFEEKLESQSPEE